MGLTRIPLDDGGSILVRTDSVDDSESRHGPVRAGRAADRVQEIAVESSLVLTEAIDPVVRMSKQLLAQLQQARPRALSIEFGIELNAEAGAIVTKAGASCHLTVTVANEC